MIRNRQTRILRDRFPQFAFGKGLSGKARPRQTIWAMPPCLMPKFIAALTVTTALGVGAASAADLAARPYTKAPALCETVYNWSGFYLGGHIAAPGPTSSWVNSANTTAFGDLRTRPGLSAARLGLHGWRSDRLQLAGQQLRVRRRGHVLRARQFRPRHRHGVRRRPRRSIQLALELHGNDRRSCRLRDAEQSALFQGRLSPA